MNNVWILTYHYGKGDTAQYLILGVFATAELAKQSIDKDGTQYDWEVQNPDYPLLYTGKRKPSPEQIRDEQHGVYYRLGSHKVQDSISDEI